MRSSSRGYEILDKSPDAGVNLFVKRKQRSLFVHFQGHPEYFTRTLLKEYRRDVRRYLTHERETYPNEPRGYFDAEATRILNEFRKNAEANRQEDLMEVFPEAAVGETLQNTGTTPQSIFIVTGSTFFRSANPAAPQTASTAGNERERRRPRASRAVTVAPRQAPPQYKKTRTQGLKASHSRYFPVHKTQMTL